MSVYLQQAEAYAQHQASLFMNDYLAKVQQEKLIPQPPKPENQEPRRQEDDQEKVFQVYRILNLPIEALKGLM